MSVLPDSPARTSRDAARPWGLAAAVLTGQAMASLDTAIVNVAGPSLQRGLHLSGAALQLAVYAYVLTYAVTLVLGAQLGARWGYGRTFVSGTALFTASSLACGVAAGPAMLVTARALQGLGAALLVPQVLSILQVTFDGERRRRALSLYGMVLAVGVAAGQVLGGLLVTADLFGTGWRPIFLVNVPVGLAVLAYSARRLPPGIGTIRTRLDVTGATLLAAAILALVLPLTFGPDSGWPGWTWPVLLAGTVLVPVFVRHEARLASAGRPSLLDLRLLAQIRGPLTGIFVLMAGYGGLLFTIALYLQHVRHESALGSGLTFAGYAAGFAAASLTWTRVATGWHVRVPAIAITAILAADAALAGLVAGGGWSWPPIALLAMAGAGHGAGFGALVQRAAGSQPAERAASLSGIISTTNQLAIVAGIAAAGTLYLSISPSTLRLPAMFWVLIALAALHAILALALLVGQALSTPTEAQDDLQL